MEENNQNKENDEDKKKFLLTAWSIILFKVLAPSLLSAMIIKNFSEFPFFIVFIICFMVEITSFYFKTNKFKKVEEAFKTRDLTLLE